MTMRAPWILAAALLLTAVPAAAVDYPGAAWFPAASGNYSVADREADWDITYIVVHVAEGSYSGTINWFQDSAAEASAHYVVAQDGRVAQMVPDKDIAWHAGNWEYNKHGLGVEHEGFTGSASTWTEAMYQASARLVRWLADAHGVALAHPTGVMPASATTQTGIIGHDQVPDPDNPSLGGGVHHHTDPGASFDWARFMALVRGDAFDVRIVAPSDNAWQRGTLSALGTTNQDGSLQWARWLLDGSVTRWATAAPHAWTFGTQGYAEGAHALRFEARNGAGTLASDAITLRIDNTPPAVQLTRPAAGTVNVGPASVADGLGVTVAVGDVPVAASASDALSGVASVVFSVDGAPRAADTAAPFAWSWPAQDEALGGHTLAATAYDAAGNAATSSLAVHLTAPTSPAGLAATLDRLV